MSDEKKPRRVPRPNAMQREVILWVLVALCQLGYPVGPLLAQMGVPLPIGNAHSAHAPEATPTP